MDVSVKTITSYHVCKHHAKEHPRRVRDKGKRYELNPICISFPLYQNFKWSLCSWRILVELLSFDILSLNNFPHFNLFCWLPTSKANSNVKYVNINGCYKSLVLFIFKTSSEMHEAPLIFSPTFRVGVPPERLKTINGVFQVFPKSTTLLC